MNKTFLLLLGAVGVASSALLGAPAGDREGPSAALPRAPKDTTSEFVISFWSTGEGLPVNEILDLKETPDGYLWLGTHHGLVRFDGVRFETFFRTPTGLRYGARVTPLEVDSRGRLWAAPDATALVYLEAGTFYDVLTNVACLPTRVGGLCSDGTNGLLWVDIKGGLGRVLPGDPNRAEPVAGPGSVGARWLRDFQGQLWLAGSRNLRVFRNAQWRDLGMPTNSAVVATPRSAGGLWFARDARLRFILADGTRRTVADFPWRNQSRVTRMMEDKLGRLWIGTETQGLFCYAAGQFKQVVNMASAISCLLEDSQDNIWAGTEGAGLVRLRQRHLFVQDLRGGLPNEFVRSLAQDRAGRLWVLTKDTGLGWWQSGAWRTLDRPDGWPRLDALCLFPANDGGVWISTVKRGLCRWSDGQFSEIDLGPNAPKEPAVDLLQDRQGRLWMVTDNLGIYCLNGTNLTAYSTAGGLPSERMRGIVQDEAGDIWAGDWQGGIARFRDGKWELARQPSSSRDLVRGFIALEGALWIGTEAGGLLRFKQGKTDRISVEQGLPDNCLQQLLADGIGFLWAATPYRLFRVSLDELNAVMDGRLEKVQATTYGRSDGLPEVSFGDWHDPRCWRTTEGELWFATANGAIHFNPGDLRESRTPQVLLEQMLLDGKPVTADALQHLRAEPGTLEFQFTAPCLSAPERIRFRYQMTGVDAGWVDAGSARSVTYASIPAGEHVFRVLASSPDGVWGSRPAEVALAVHPYFWQTSWFLAAVTAAVAGGGVWIFRRATVRRLGRRLERMRQQHAVDQERARIAQDIHDELGANLTSIGLLADMGARHKSDPGALSRDLGHISQTARASVASMDAIVWALNPRNDSLDHFANYVAQFTRDFFRPTQLRTRLELPADLPTLPLATETRHQLFLLVKESFNNVVRHAQATEVRLELACENGHLRLSVADDGKGLPQQAAGAGQDGLVNLRQRIERLGGTLAVKSEPGRGTRLDFVLPLAKFKAN